MPSNSGRALGRDSNDPGKQKQFYFPNTLKKKKEKKKTKPTKPKNQNHHTGLEKKQPEKIQVACLRSTQEQALFDTENIPILANVPVVPRKVKLRISL